MSKITSEQVSKPPPGAILPLSVAFSPTGRFVTYLFPDSNGLRQVFAIDTTAGASPEPFKLVDLSVILQSQKTLSLQEQLRRERMRLFTTGVTSYEWGSAGNVMLIPLGGEVLLYDADPNRKDGALPLRSIYDGSAGASVDPHLSPDCSRVAFVINDDLYVSTITSEESGSGAAPQRLTVNGAKPGFTCGLADFIAQEEMDRYRGFWWSPSSKMIAYTETDETHIPEYQILHQGKVDPAHSETHRYPFAGQPNPRVRLAVLQVPPPDAPSSSSSSSSSESTSSASSVWMDVADGGDVDPADYYIGRVGWWPDDSVLCQVQTRSQMVLQLLRLDPHTGTRTVLVEERSAVWINLHDILHVFPSSAGGDFRFLWASERSGFSQLYLYQFSAASKTCAVLLGGLPVGGGGEWCVETIDAVDDKTETVYFSGNKGVPTDKHLFSASFAERHYSNGAVDPAAVSTAITTTPGWHSSAVCPASKLFADVYSSKENLPRATLYSFSSGTPVAIKEFISPEQSHPEPYALEGVDLGLQTPEIVSLPSRDGKVTLYCALYKPDPSVHGPGPYATIVSVYGGPHVQRVTDSWELTRDLRAQRLAQDGCFVIKCDNRGSSRRGVQFEGAIRWSMGGIEIDDQQAAVQHFVAKGLVDATRVGMFGWSYGGYMSAMSLCRAPETFCCAVAGAPVTSWDGYDTHYTERYMGRPVDNPAGYEASSVMSYVEGMSGKLLLVHGLIDENVHFRHTARLINKLIEKRKQYDLILFPCERHSPHKVADRIYLEDRIMKFFELAFASVGSALSTELGTKPVFVIASPAASAGGKQPEMPLPVPVPVPSKL